LSTRNAAARYGKREWTMERIAEALSVSKATISGDLSNLFNA
jgi:predicted transcriptional regulator